MNNSDYSIIHVNNDNIEEAGVFCIKDKKAAGYKKKISWFKSRINQGLKIKIAVNDTGKQIGFIEYTPSELSWRPVNAFNYYFIHCLVIFSKKDRHNNLGSELIQLCEKEAKEEGKNGVCTMSSKGAWIADKTIFENNDFEISDKLGRFELMYKSFSKNNEKPSFFNWEKAQQKLMGWNLIYSDQCPWHDKGVEALLKAAQSHKISLQVKKLTTPAQAQKAPSGFGTFSLIKDGKLLSDHYISKTRFENILKSELK